MSQHVTVFTPTNPNQNNQTNKNCVTSLTSSTKQSLMSPKAAEQHCFINENNFCFVPTETKTIQNILQPQHQNNQQQKIRANTRILLRKQLQIYTDWANHYLQKRYNELYNENSNDESSDNKDEVYRNPRRRLISSLASDLQDGVLLVYIVESISDSSLANTTTNPKTPKEMIGNIEVCIKYLSQLGVSVKEIQAKDIYEGNLKSILTLFFNVSRYKQSLKQSQQYQQAQCPTIDPASRTFRFPAPPPQNCAGFRSPQIVNSNQSAPQFNFNSGYASDPGTPYMNRPSAYQSVRLPSIADQSHQNSSITQLAHPFQSPTSSASSITSLLSAASLPPNNNSSTTATPSTAMISRLPSSSSSSNTNSSSHHHPNHFGSNTKLPTHGSSSQQSSTRIATSSSIPQQLSSSSSSNNPNSSISSGGSTNQHRNRISIPNRNHHQNTSVPSSRSTSPGGVNVLGSSTSNQTATQLSLSSPSPYGSSTHPSPASSNPSQSSLPTSSRLTSSSSSSSSSTNSITPNKVSGLKVPQTPRPNSTSSIPQVGAFSSAIKPAVVVQRSITTKTSPTSSSTSGIAKQAQQTSHQIIKSNPNSGGGTETTAGGSSVAFRSSKQQAPSNVNNPTKTGVKYRIGQSTQSQSTAESNGGPKFSNQLSSLKAAQSSRIGSLGSLKGRLPQASKSSDGTRSRPISTIIESSSNSSSSSIQSMNAMASSSSQSIGGSANHSPQSSICSITKPTATVKAMVTPIMTTNHANSHTKRPSPTESIKLITKTNQNQDSTKLSFNYEVVDTNHDDNESEVQNEDSNTESNQNLDDEPLENDDDNEEEDADSGDSQNSSDIESALASIEPMQPIERPSMQNFSYLNNKTSNPATPTNGPHHHRSMDPNGSNQLYEDYSDNSESQTEVKTVVNVRLHKPSSSNENLLNRNTTHSNSNIRASTASQNQQSRMTVPHMFGGINHLSDSTTLLNLHLRPNRASSCRTQNAKSQGEFSSNNQNNNLNQPMFVVGFDETSSLSSDPGMISGTDVSTGTTTTSSSMCSSTDQRVYSSNKKLSSYGQQNGSSKSAKSGSKLTFFNDSGSTRRINSNSSQKNSPNSLPNGSSNRKSSSLTSSNGDLSSASTATPTNGTLPKCSRPLSSPSSKNLVVHAGTLPLNGSRSSLKNGSSSNRYLNKSQSKLRTATLANGCSSGGSSEQVYSDSECVQQRSLMYRMAARNGTLPPTVPGTGTVPTVAIGTHPNYGQITPQVSIGNSLLYHGKQSKDGAALDYSNPNAQPQNIYSNTMEVYSKASPSHQPYFGRNAFTDTESVESLNLGSDLGLNHLYGNMQQQQQNLNVNPNNNYGNYYPSHHLSKPGDLIYEYESLNRGLRETMSASPTMMITNKLGIPGTDGTQNSLGRNGSFRAGSTPNGTRGYAQFDPQQQQQQQNELNNRPPAIPAHMNSASKVQIVKDVDPSQSGSSLSLLSNSSSMFAGAPDDKYIHEIRRLRSELDQSNEKIFTLTQQLTTNAHMVAAFEQSLSSMTSRLQQLTSTSEIKDCELDRLRKTIEALRQQGGNLVSGVKQTNRTLNRKGSATSTDYTDGESTSTNQTLPRLLPMSMNGSNVGALPPTKNHRYHKNHNNNVQSQLLIRRHTFNNALLSPTTTSKHYSSSEIYDGKYQHRQLSTESVNSVSSCGEPSKTKKKSKLKSITGNNASWIRSSFSRAFKKNKSKNAAGTNREFMSDAESGNESGRKSSNANDNSRSVPSSPLLSVRSFKTSTSTSSSDHSKGIDGKTEDGTENVQDLHKQLRDKEMQLTDMRLETLTSAHQMENLKEMLNQMRLEMTTLKQDNDRLQRMMNHKSLASSVSSLATSTHMAPNGVDVPNGNNNVQHDANSLESVEIDGFSSNGSDSTGGSSGLKPVTLGSGSHTLASFGINSKTNWDQLDTLVKKLFKEHLIRVDSSLALGITVDSLACYRVGSEAIQRNFQYDLVAQQNPELLPFGYLVEESHINVQFKSAMDSLAFDTLTPKSILSQFMNLLSENRRLILAGPSGTGKTYLAHKLAEYLVIQQQLAQPADDPTHQHFGPAITSGAIATFNVDHKNAKELRAYLSNIAEQCEHLVENDSLLGSRSPISGVGLPIVIILDNLHHIDDSLVVDIFKDLYRLNQGKSPFIIGTINQNVATNQTMSEMFRRFHFRLATFSVHTEPVKGFLTRFLRRKWLEAEAKAGRSNHPDGQLGRIVDWVPKVCVYLNRFLESFFPQQNISIGPRLFTSCPMDQNGSQIWFTDLWNFSILPFITENLRDLLSKSRSNSQQIYARLKEKFIDPTDWIVENYPWNYQNSSSNGSSSNSNNNGGGSSTSSGSHMEWSDHLNRLRLEDILEQHEMSIEQGGGQRSGSSASGKFSASGKPPVPVSVSQQIDKINDPFLEMLNKLKEASQTNNNNNSSQDGAM